MATLSNSINGKNFFALFALASFFFSLVLPGFVSADGMGFVQDPDMGWRLMPERQQYAAINYANGIEKMILLVDADLNGEKAVWIFPVPAAPSEVKIDVLKGFPLLHGSDIQRNNAVSDALLLGAFSQVYIFPLGLIFLIGARGAMGAAGTAGEGIDVYQHVEKMGLTTELVSAVDGNALYEYLKAKGLELPPDSRLVGTSYSNETICPTCRQYSFVVSWVSNVTKFRAESEASRYGYYGVGVFASFPADKMFFPLKPTSVYGEEEIPVVLYVLGHVTPEAYPEISGATRATYYEGGYYDVPAELAPFFENFAANPSEYGVKRIYDLKYTKIKIDSSAGNFVDDLWIENAAPSWVGLRSFVNGNFWLVFAVLFSVLSCLASVAAGAIVFRGRKPNLPKFAFLGLANFATVIGFYFAARGLKVGEKFVSSKPASKPSSPSAQNAANDFSVPRFVWMSALLLPIALFALFHAGNGFGPYFNFGAELLLMFIAFVLLLLVEMFFVVGYRLLTGAVSEVLRFVLSFSILFLVFTVLAGLALSFV